VGPAVPEEELPRLSSGQYDSFVVRVLHRTTKGGLVHAQVTHVGTRRTRRFTSLEAAMGFIKSHLGNAEPESEAGAL